MSKILLKILQSLLCLFISFSTSASVAHAWYGAGRTPGWEPTTSGLSGEIALPIYKFSPDYYYTGNTVTISASGINGGESNISSPMYLSISRVTEAPRGVDITDGDPDNPGLNENQLYNYHLSGDDRQTIVAVIPLGTTTFPAMSQAVIRGSYTPAQPGYYQFDFIDFDPRSGYVPGHILAAGFFRVLVNPEDTEIEPSPSPSITPTPTASPAPSNGGSVSGASTSSSECTDQAPGAPVLRSIVSNGNNSVTLNWTKATDPVSYYLIAYGTEAGKYIYGNPNIGGEDTTSYTVNNLSGNARYYFVVRAGNGCKPGPFSNEMSASVLGRIIVGPSTGFTEGVLGESTIALEEEAPSSSPVSSGSIIGVSDKQAECRPCLWWQILLAQLVLALAVYFRGGIQITKRRILVVLGISVIAYIIWMLVNKNACMSPICQKFWIWDILVAMAATGVSKLLLLKTHEH